MSREKRTKRKEQRGMSKEQRVKRQILAEIGNNEVKAAGEYYTAARLSAMGYRVSLAMGNNQGFDLFVSNGEKDIHIQVKTTRGPEHEWVTPLIKKAEPNLVYVFVNLNPAGDCPSPSFHIVKSKDVKKFLDEGVEKFREDYKKRHNGVGPDETAKGVNNFKDKEGKYIEKWQLLGLKAPVVEEAEDKKPPASKRKGKKKESKEG
jgi:hypothetical protein